jgi:hypothetical protein
VDDPAAADLPGAGAGAAGAALRYWVGLTGLRSRQR